jgi:hypothetical protein
VGKVNEEGKNPAKMARKKREKAKFFPSFRSML